MTHLTSLWPTIDAIAIGFGILALVVTAAMLGGFRARLFPARARARGIRERNIAQRAALITNTLNSVCGDHGWRLTFYDDGGGTAFHFNDMLAFPVTESMMVGDEPLDPIWTWLDHTHEAAMFGAAISDAPGTGSPTEDEVALAARLHAVPTDTEETQAAPAAE